MSSGTLKQFSGDKRWLLVALLASAALLLGILGRGHFTASAQGGSGGLGQMTGKLNPDHLVLESAIQVDLDKETVRLPLYKGTAPVGEENDQTQTVWFIITEASDLGLAKNSGLNFAPKLANIAINCPECVQTVTIDSPTPAQNRFGQATFHFQGAPIFNHHARVLVPGPNGFPPAAFDPGAIAGPHYSPFIRIKGSPVVYNAPIVATGNGPFDVEHHTNTSPRALGIHIENPPFPSGQFLESWVDILFVKGFDAGQPILYMSTEAGDPLAATLERSVFVPALAKAAYNGGDDFVGSARERLFAFANGQTGADNPNAQGFAHLILDGHASEDASASNAPLIDALRHGGDVLNVFGDFPTLKDPRHADAYSPLWDAQIGAWTEAAMTAGVNTRQIDENVVFNLAAQHPEWLTGPGGAPYGAQGVDVNCAVIGFTADPPTANLVAPAPNSQFPPR